LITTGNSTSNKISVAYFLTFGASLQSSHTHIKSLHCTRLSPTTKNEKRDSCEEYEQGEEGPDKEGKDAMSDEQVGDGNSYEEALADVKSAIAFHFETFGAEVLDDDSALLEAFVAEASFPT
jgi:predicted RNase H-like HicB family nuclease